MHEEASRAVYGAELGVRRLWTVDCPLECSTPARRGCRAAPSSFSKIVYGCMARETTSAAVTHDVPSVAVSGCAVRAVPLAWLHGQWGCRGVESHEKPVAGW
jgi:hypothetical protein